MMMKMPKTFFFACMIAGSSAFVPSHVVVTPKLSTSSMTPKSDPRMATFVEEVVPSQPVIDPEVARLDTKPSPDEERSERVSLDISKTIYTSSIKAPKDAYIACAEKGASNAHMSARMILAASILGGCFVGFGGLLSLSVAGNMAGVAGPNPGLAKMTFAALFPVNLLLILTTGGQLFTGNSATVAAAKLEGLVTWRELARSWALSIVGNIVGCSLFAYATLYTGLLTGGTAELAVKTAIGKCGSAFGPTLVKAIMCNWMVSMAVFLAGASNDLTGKMVGIWFPISTFVAIGLEHSVANMFILPAALLAKAPVSLADVIVKNLIPVTLGNAIAGALIVAGGYSFQYGKMGKAIRSNYRKFKRAYNKRKEDEAAAAM